MLDSLAVKEHTALLLTSRHAIAPARVHALNLQALTDASGAALFIQRLKQLDPARPTTQEQACVAEIVEAVGGLPLAIEQVASYAGVQRIALDRQLDQLRAHGVNAVAFRADPQRLLTTVFDRSWEALAAEPHRQRLFAALSLLAGPSFPRAAALALAASARFAGHTGDTNPTNDGASDSADPELDVGTLVSYALIEPLAEERLRLHPLLRDYAAFRLARYPHEVRESLGDAMVTYWLGYAEPLASQLHGGIDALEAEAPGLLGALDWAHAHGRAASVAELADALRLFWQERWHTRESHHFLPWGLEAAETTAKETGARADALRVVHLRLAYGQALAASGGAGERKRGGEAERLLHHSLDAARALDDRETVCAAHLELGGLALQHSDAQQAEAEYRQVLQIAEAHDDLHAKSLSLRGLGDIAFSHRDLEQAEHYYRQVLADVERIPDRQDRDMLQRSLLFSMGQVAQLRGAMTQAEGYHRQALKRAEIANSPQDIATLLYCIGWVALQRGQFGEAEGLLEEVYDRLHQAEDAQGSSVCLSRLGEIALKRQQWTLAQAYFQRALQLAETLDDAQGQSAIQYQLGKLHLHQDLLEPAEQYFSAALKLNATTHDRMAEGMDLTGLGQIALKRHRLDEAEGLFQRSLVLLEQASDRLGEAITRRWLAETVEADGRLDLAAELYQTSLELARAVESALDVADGQAALGRFLIVQRDERERGCLLLREAEQGYTAMKLSAQANVVRALAQRLGCGSTAGTGNETIGNREALQGRQNATLS